MIKRGTARRLGIRRPVMVDPFAALRRMGATMDEIAEQWPATMQGIRRALERS